MIARSRSQTRRGSNYLCLAILITVTAVLTGCQGLVSKAGLATSLPSPAGQQNSPAVTPLKIETNSLPAAQPSVTYKATLLTTGGAPPIIWSISSGALPSGLNLDGSAGTISGNTSQQGSFPFQVMAKDSGGTTAAAPLTIVVSSASGPLSIQTTALVGGALNVFYLQYLQAAGGAAPYLWRLEEGALPPGLTLGVGNGQISGTPTQVGTFSFRAQVQDATNKLVTSTLLSITINSVSLAIIVHQLEFGAVGFRYSSDLQATGGTPPYRFAITQGTLPGGISLNAGSGNLSGVPTAAGNFSFSFQVTDAVGQIQTSTASISIAPAPDLSQPVASSWFGMHIRHILEGTPWPSQPVGLWRLWLGWPELEPQRGVYDFSLLDQYIAIAQQHNADVILTLGYSPQWASSQPTQVCTSGIGVCAPPANMQDWDDYVATVAKRYKGQIRYYEIWNEPNLGYFYTGSLDAMIRLTKEAYGTIKAIDSNAKVLSPAAVGGGGVPWLISFFAGGGGSYVDIIAYHFYVKPNPPEGMYLYIPRIRGVLEAYNIAKPLWDTELGWDSITLSDDQQTGYLVRSILMDWVNGITSTVWYEWDNHDLVTIYTTEPDNTTVTAAGRAFGVIQNWLVGANLVGCTSTDIPWPSGTSHAPWTCQITRNGVPAYIVWNPDGDLVSTIPATWNVNQVEFLDGTTAPVAGNTVLIGVKPIMLDLH